MSDSLGPVPIPPAPQIPAFPIQGDYGGGMDFDPPIAIHSFNQAGLKTEQRFVLGSGVRRFRVQRDHLSCGEYDALKAHWIQAQGTYAEFPFTYHRGAAGAETVQARYENPSITFPQLIGLITGDPGVTLLEVPTVTPPYTTAATIERFPDIAFTDALREQAQHLIPCIAIQDRAKASGPVYLSNQRFTLDGTLYLPRLLDWDGISQTLGDSSDSGSFTFGNADGVFVQFANQINLNRALVQFALYHVESRYLIKLWSGYATPWRADPNGRFQLGASDGVFELGLGYPVRVVSRTCWKVYKGRYCPSTSSLPDCNKSWANCNERGVPQSFGGVIVPAQAVHVKDYSTGVLGFGRSILTSVSIAADTVYQRTLSEVYTDIAMPVQCDVAIGRDESDYYAAIGIVGEGPLGGYVTDLVRQRLDDQPPHDPLHNGGWRGITGSDPAPLNDYFGLDQSPWVKDVKGWLATEADLPISGNAIGDGWITQDTQRLNVWNGVAWFDNGPVTFAAGVAFAEIRRSDEIGLQLSTITDRKMTVMVQAGIGGWTWTAPGARVWTPGLSNPVWVAVNIYLRALGLRADQARGDSVTPAAMEAFFDVKQAIASAAICDAQVDKLVGEGKERQYPFRGVLKERKPLRDWLQEIMNCCLGYFTFVNGKLWIGIRVNSSVGPGNAYTRDTILFKSLQTTPLQPKFNQLVGQFGDEEFDFELNNVTVYDMDQAALSGTPESPQFNSSNITYVGVSNKSQAARITTTRLREEIGGLGPDEQRRARSLSFRTTVLALRTMVGDVISLDDDSLPDTHHIEARVSKWVLNPDFSIDIAAVPSADSMYTLTIGAKPDDVPADPPIPARLPSITGLSWMPNAIGPAPGDPLYPDPLSRTFELWQDYNITREGAWDAALWVAGDMPVNQYATGDQPRIAGSRLVAGGTFAGPATVYLAVTQNNPANGQPLAPSNLTALWIPEGVSGQAVHLDLLPSQTADVTWPWFLWGGYDRRTICQQATGTNLPLTMTVNGPFHANTQGMPEAAARRLAIGAKLEWHSGIAGVLVTGVTAPNKMQADDFIGSADNWIGRIISALADQSDGSAPLWNFTVTAFDSASGTLTVSPDCVRADPADSVQPGDVLIVRSGGATAPGSVQITADATSYTDPMWNNSVGRNQFDSPGLRPDEEIGRVVRVLFGTGAGQFRYISGNTATTITVKVPWDVIPDASSVLIVEAADWTYQMESSDLAVAAAGYRVELRQRVENLRDHVALVGGFLVDDRDRFSDESVAPLREIYVFGQPPTVRQIGPASRDPDSNLWQSLATDHTIRADTSINEIVLQLCPLYLYQGRTLMILNDTLGSLYDVLVRPYPGEVLFDGSTEVRIPPGNTLRVTAG